MYKEMGRVAHNVAGDGACFKNAVLRCLMLDFSPPLLMNMSLLSHQILEEMESRWDFYLPFCNFPGLYTPDLDEFKNHVLTCLSDNKWDTTIMDVLVQATSYALKMNLCVFTREQASSNVQVLQFGPGNTARRIYLELDCGHYKAVVKYNVTLDISGLPKADSDYFLSQLGVQSSPVEKGQVKQVSVLGDPEVPVEAKQIQDSTPHPHVSMPEDTPDSSQTSSPVTEATTDTFEYNPEEPIQIVEKSSRAYFPFHLYKGKEPQQVSKCPEAINGFRLYKVPLEEGENPHTLAADRRRFRMRCSKSKELQRVGAQRKVGWCSGSLVCQNDSCSFFRMATERNTDNWDRSVQEEKGGKNCFSCGSEGFHQECYGRKCVEIFKDHLMIYHINWHTCSLKRQKNMNDDLLQEVIEKHPGMSAGEASMEDCMTAMRTKGIDEMYRRAQILSDTKRLRYLQQKEKNSNLTCGRESIEAMLMHQAECKKRDPFLCYKMNLTPGDKTPTYVFKTCKEAVALALDMDVSGKHQSPMQEEECYFDGQHSRCKGYVTLALYTCIQAMRKIICIARMECASESSATIHLFFHFLNQAMQEHSGDPALFFNPVKIITDAHSANENGIGDCFGAAYRKAKQIGCQKHYTDNVGKFAAKLPVEYRSYFTKVALNAMHSTNAAQYKQLSQELYRMGRMFPQVMEHVKWWDLRRYHHVDFFRGTHFKATNQAEAGHASFRDKTQLWLVEAAQQDACKFAVQGFMIKRFLSGQLPSDGKGPSQASLERKAMDKQKKIASGMTSILKRVQEYEEKESMHNMKKPKVQHDDEEDLVIDLSEDEEPVLNLDENTLLVELEEDLDSTPANNFTAPKTEKHRPRDGKKNATPKGKGKGKRSSAKTFIDHKAAIEEIIAMSDAGTRENNIAMEQVPSTSTVNDTSGPTLQKHKKYLHHNLVDAYPFALESPVSDNPPTLMTVVESKARKCIACRFVWAAEERKTPPTDMCFKVFCHRPWRRPTGKVLDKIVPGYIHCRMSCLQLWDPRIQCTDVVVPRSTLDQCTRDHLLHFEQQGFLRTIYSNIQD